MNSRISSNNLSFTSKIFSERLRFCCIHIMATISNSPLPIENNCAPTLETIRLTLSIFVNLSEQFLVQSSWPSGHILCMVFDYFLFQLIVLELSVTKKQQFSIFEISMHLFQHSKSRDYSRLRNKILLLFLFCWPWVVVREASWMPMLHADKALKDREIGKSSTDKKNTQRKPFPFQIYQHWDMKK